MTRGRPEGLIHGITARQWASALGDVTATSLRRARAIISGTTRPSPRELVTVAAACGVDLAELVRAVAELAARRR